MTARKNKNKKTDEQVHGWMARIELLQQENGARILPKEREDGGEAAYRNYNISRKRALIYFFPLDYAGET